MGDFDRKGKGVSADTQTIADILRRLDKLECCAGGGATSYDTGGFYSQEYTVDNYNTVGVTQGLTANTWEVIDLGGLSSALVAPAVGGFDAGAGGNESITLTDATLEGLPLIVQVVATVVTTYFGTVTLGVSFNGDVSGNVDYDGGSSVTAASSGRHITLTAYRVFPAGVSAGDYWEPAVSSSNTGDINIRRLAHFGRILK